MRDRVSSLPLPLFFLFDNEPKFQGAASELYREYQTAYDPNGEIFGGIDFGGRKKYKPLQIADLLVGLINRRFEEMTRAVDPELSKIKKALDLLFKKEREKRFGPAQALAKLPRPRVRLLYLQRSPTLGRNQYRTALQQKHEFTAVTFRRFGKCLQVSAHWPHSLRCKSSLAIARLLGVHHLGPGGRRLRSNRRIDQNYFRFKVRRPCGSHRCLVSMRTKHRHGPSTV